VSQKHATRLFSYFRHNWFPKVFHFSLTHMENLCWLMVYINSTNWNSGAKSTESTAAEHDMVYYSMDLVLLYIGPLWFRKFIVFYFTLLVALYTPKVVELSYEILQLPVDRVFHIFLIVLYLLRSCHWRHLFVSTCRKAIIMLKLCWIHGLLSSNIQDGPKKLSYRILSISSLNIDQFSQFFHQ